MDRFSTHVVENQPPLLQDYNPFETDQTLQKILQRYDAAWAADHCHRFGKLLGHPRSLELAEQANQFLPELKVFDRFGNRIDEVMYHPAYHELMGISMENHLHCLPWHPDFAEAKGSHLARASHFYLMSQIEYGHLCPISMTYAVVPSLRKQPEVYEEWKTQILSTEYDAQFAPIAEKNSALFGMAMTEKQGGSDLSETQTVAEPLTGQRGSGQVYEVTGHKWFCSAPMCDAFLTLARTEKGISCFLLPRFTPDGFRNRFHIQRLKDKVGNRSNASAEVEFQGAWARMIGEEGRGIATIIEMAVHTRLDCVASSAGMMRSAFMQALNHCRGRRAFGAALVDQPLMKNVLSDLYLESEMGTLTMARLAASFDGKEKSEYEARFQRIATAIAKYWVCKRAVAVSSEAMECLGGNGFVDEHLVARLFREAPLNSIWEGSGNVICLDVMRAIHKDPKTLEVLVTEIEKGLGMDSLIDQSIENLKALLSNPVSGHERYLVERMALALQGSLAVQHGDEELIEAFCRSRLGSDKGLLFGNFLAEPFQF